MQEHSVAYVGMDTSKLRNAVAIAQAGRDGEIRYLGEIDNTPAATARLVRKSAKQYPVLRFAHEAGPTGYGLYRQITGLGHECRVAAPSPIVGQRDLDLAAAFVPMPSYVAEGFSSAVHFRRRARLVGEQAL